MTRFWVCLLTAALFVSACSRVGWVRDTAITPPPIESGNSKDEKTQRDTLREVAKRTRMQNSALGRLILEQSPGADLLNWNEAIPETIPEWINLLEGGTDKVSGLLIPFSLAPTFTSLETPRIVLTAPDGSPERGKIFLGITNLSGESVIEFISWNSARGAFDFGAIKQLLGQQKAEFAHEPTCFACHRGRSPIFPAETWDNTVVNRSVLAAFVDVQAKANPHEFKELNDGLSDALTRDNQGRAQNPPVMEDFIDYHLQDAPLFSEATYAGFPFVDPYASQAFDFNQAIFEAHALVVASDWLQTLPNQEHASQIVNKGSFSLIEEHPEHYKTLSTYNSPYLENYNVVAREVNTFDSINDVVPLPENIAAVRRYNTMATENKKHPTPLKHVPTSASAFEDETSDWQDYLTGEIIGRAFGDKKYEPNGLYGFKHADKVVPHEQLCSSCHSGSGSSPYPDFSGFNPLSESEWTRLFAEDYGEVEELLCMTLNRVCSVESPMPPSSSAERESFSTYLQSTVLSLQTLVERHQVSCLVETACATISQNSPGKSQKIRGDE